MHKLVTILFFFTLSIASVQGQKQKDLSGIVNKIKAINYVGHESVGWDEEPSENAKNFLDLKNNANTAQLIILTDDNNEFLACYAGWALIDNSYNDLPSIFIKFLNNDKNVFTNFYGCMTFPQPLSSLFYHRYWNIVSEKATDKTLFTLDSLILYKDECYSLLIKRALEDRIYPRSFNKRIEYLACKKANKDAITYLKKLNNKTYDEPIKQATIKYFEETNFSYSGSYLETIKELLNYNDEKLKPLIIQKLKKDTSWRGTEKKFYDVLLKYGIQPTDIK